MFTILALIVCLIDIISLLVKQSLQISNPIIFFRIIINNPYLFIVTGILLTSVSCLSVLCSYHMYIVLQGVTTYENLRPQNISPDTPYYGCCRYLSLICTENSSSKLQNLHEMISADKFIEEYAFVDNPLSATNESYKLTQLRNFSKKTWRENIIKAKQQTYQQV